MASYTYISLVLVVVVVGAVFSSAHDLSADFYLRTCPNLLPIVKKVVRKAIKRETRLGASLLRLQFHDCFVNGCDGSVLLDDNGSFIGEKTARPNHGSIRGLEVIDAIKAEVEEACPGVVSCADIITLAARDSVIQLGGPSWEVPLGRRDSKAASLSAANQFLPAPFLNLSGLISSFSVQGLSAKDLVALSGAHTIGQASCITFSSRAFTDANIDPSFAKSLQNKCQLRGSNTALAPLDLKDPKFFDNSYFKNILLKRGLLHSDQELSNGKYTSALVKKYASDTQTFFKDFAEAMIKMGNIKPLTGSQGEIRINCRKVNYINRMKL